jgi:HSP20 family protein
MLMNTLFPVTRFGGLSTIDRDVESLFDTFFGSGILPTNRKASVMTTPRANVTKNPEGYAIELAAPGLSREDFSINVDNNLLSVSVKDESTVIDESVSYTSREYSMSSFTRSWTLPEGAALKGIDARYEAGILTLDIPVSGNQNSQLSIEVK